MEFLLTWIKNVFRKDVFSSVCSLRVEREVLSFSLYHFVILRFHDVRNFFENIFIVEYTLI